MFREFPLISEEGEVVSTASVSVKARGHLQESVRSGLTCSHLGIYGVKDQYLTGSYRSYNVFITDWKPEICANSSAVEHLVYTEAVGGSNPSSRTKFPRLFSFISR